MNARFNEITDAHDDTFNRVFDAPAGEHQKWPSFTQWLADNSSFYLVQGKAGSGKSTFVKFLFEHATTRSLLQSRDASQPVIILYHNIWFVGSKLQHGWKGLLASLSFQLVSSTSTLLEHCGTFPWRSKHLLSDWSEKELQSFLSNMLSGSKITLCIFIDGLDEFSY